MLEHYPLWVGHDCECKIAHIKPSFNHKEVFQGWDISIIFPGETARYLVSTQHVKPV